MKGMFEDKSVKYCHYDEDNDTFISHTKLNIPLIGKILLDKKLETSGKEILEYLGYTTDSFTTDKLADFTESVNEKLSKKFSTDGTEEEKKGKKEFLTNLATLLNLNFSKHIEIDAGALTRTDPDGISDFAVVGEELERTYFRGENCKEAKDAFLKKYVTKEKGAEGLQQLEAFQKVALVLNKSNLKGKDKAGKDIKIKNFHDLNPRLDPNSNLAEIVFPIITKIKEVEYSITKEGDNISIFEGGKKIGAPFTMKEAGELFAKAINSNLNSRAYSLYNQGALLNFSGGLYGYENDRPKEALDLGCSHIVGHRPTIQAENKNFISLNTPVVTGKGASKTLQTDYNGKNEERYINCRITKFGKDGHPHLLGVSRMLESKIKEKGEGETTQKKSSDPDVDGEMKEKAKELFKNLFVGEGGILGEEQQTEFVNLITKGDYIENIENVKQQEGESRTLQKEIGDLEKEIGTLLKNKLQGKEKEEEEKKIKELTEKIEVLKKENKKTLEEKIEDFAAGKKLKYDDSCKGFIDTFVENHQTLIESVHLCRKYENEIKLERSKTLLEALEATNREIGTVEKLKESLYTKGPSL
jgi:hypothetical protein